MDICFWAQGDWPDYHKLMILARAAECQLAPNKNKLVHFALVNWEQKIPNSEVNIK